MSMVVLRQLRDLEDAVKALTKRIEVLEARKSPGRPRKDNAGPSKATERDRPSG